MKHGERRAPAVSDQRQWANAGPLVDSIWEDCTIGFRCVCGTVETHVDSQGDETVCSQCGRSYRLRAIVEVAAPGVPEGEEER